MHLSPAKPNCTASLCWVDLRHACGQRSSLPIAFLAHLVLSGPGHSEVAIARRNVGRVARLSIDNRATNTYENAVYSKRLVAPRAGENWAVVTSAVHMPRAIGAFQATGFHVLPWPIADTPREPDARSAWVWHEIGGLIGYRIFGHTRDLYPRFTTATAQGDRPAT